jgi:hypothetical protein
VGEHQCCKAGNGARGALVQAASGAQTCATVNHTLTRAAQHAVDLRVKPSVLYTDVRRRPGRIPCEGRCAVYTAIVRNAPVHERAARPATRSILLHPTCASVAIVSQSICCSRLCHGLHDGDAVAAIHTFSIPRKTRFVIITILQIYLSSPHTNKESASS